MPMFGPARWLIASLSSPDAAKPCAKLPHERRGRLIPRSFCSAIKSRYRRRLDLDRSMILSVTFAMVGLSVTSRPLLVPADAVALGKSYCGRRTPSARRIGPRRHPLLRPGGADPVDPSPLRFDLVAADEPSRIAFDQGEPQALVGDAPAVLAERVGEADIERGFAQPNTLAIQPRSLGHQAQLDALLGL